MFTRARVISLVLGVSLPLRFYLARGTEGLWPGALVCFFSLLLIWFPEEVNQLTMNTGGFRSPRINKETPGCIISFIGWALLIGTSLLVAFRFHV